VVTLKAVFAQLAAKLENHAVLMVEALSVAS
jgi:hypothetical protein